VNRATFFWIFVAYALINFALQQAYSPYDHYTDGDVFIVMCQFANAVWYVWAVYHRTKNCGWHGAWTLMVFVPIANIVYVLMLFFTPTKALPDYIEGESTRVR